MKSAALLCLCLCVSVGADPYTLNFSRSSTRMYWNHKLPGWRYSIPVQLSSIGDSTALLRMNASANLNYTLDQRREGKQWLENASARASLNYPILGPRASIGMSTSMSRRNATLQKQKISSQSFSFNFQYSPFQATESRFRNMRVSVTPGLITADRATRASIDSTIQETGIRYSASMSVSPNFDIGDEKLTSSFNLSKADNTLENNRNRRESLALSMGYTLPLGLKASMRLSESRSQRGVTRSVLALVVGADEVGDVVRSLVADLDKQRNTTVSTSLNGKVGHFTLNSSLSFGQSLSQNTANTATDAGNPFFLKDRKKETWKFSTSFSGKLLNPVVGRTSLKYGWGDLRRLAARLATGESTRDTGIDRTDRDISLSGGLDWQLTEVHKIAFTAQTRAIGDDNFGARDLDRDNINSSISAAYNGELGRDMNLRVSLRSSSNHKVNLAAKRSGDNARNQDLSLDVKTTYTRLGSSISHAFGVSAKRTLFDFDRRLNTNDRKSNIRRGWNMRHSLQRRFFASLQANVTYNYKADDFGELVVEQNAQVVREDNSDHSVRVGISYSPSKSFTLGSSYNYRLDREWAHEYQDLRELRQLKRRNQHQNMSLDMSYQPNRETRINMRGSRSRQRSGTFDSITATVMREL